MNPLARLQIRSSRPATTPSTPPTLPKKTPLALPLPAPGQSQEPPETAPPQEGDQPVTPKEIKAEIRKVESQESMPPEDRAYLEALRETLELCEDEEDKALMMLLEQQTLNSPDRHNSDIEPRYGRRLGWYVLVRATKTETESAAFAMLGALHHRAFLAHLLQRPFSARVQRTYVADLARLFARSLAP